MNARTKAVVGVAAVAIVALIAYGLANMSSDADVNTVNTTENATSTASIPQKGKDTFGDILKRGGTYACTVDGTVNDVAVKGTVYTNKGVARGDVNISSAVESGMASFIARDGYIYYWNSALPAGQGLKLKYDLPSYKPGDFNQFDQAGNYDCQEWTPDSSKFTVPAAIQFRESQ